MLSFHIYGQISYRVSDTFLPCILPRSTTNKTQIHGPKMHLLLLLVVLVLVPVPVAARSKA